jgi:ABC-2 type transport system permease protein
MGDRRMMLLRIAGFEIKQRSRSLSTWVYFALLFALSAFFVAITGGGVKGAVIDFGTGSKVNVNSPFSLNAVMVIIASFATPIVAAIAGRAVYQDVDHRSTALFFTKPIAKLDYLGGRFLAAFLVLFALHASLALGAFACVHAGLVDASRVGAETAWSYLQPYALVLGPNLFFTSALFFSLAALLKKMAPVYVGGVLLTLGYFIGTNLADEIGNRQLAAMVDPFGLQAIDRVTEYWTVAERSTRLLPFTGALASNRLLWSAIGAGLLVLAFLLFRFDEPPVKARPNGAMGELVPEELGGPVDAQFRTRSADALGVSLPLAAPTFSPRASAALFFRLAVLQLRETVKNVFFLVLVLAGLLFVVATVLDGDAFYGTKTYPLTYQVLELTEQGFTFFVLIITTFYAGELTWRERDARISEIVDALPIRRWVLFTSKLGALFGVQVLLVLLVLMAGIATQLIKGFYEFELPLYFQKLFLVSLPRFLVLSTLALAIHAAIDNKYVGHFVMVLYLLISIALPLLGLENPLYRFGSPPELRYSAMNGFGHYARPIAWLLAYNAAGALFLAVLANLMWVRGKEHGWKERVRSARARLSGGSRAAFMVSAALFFAIGGFIFYNTNVLNRYRSTFEKDELRARYEKSYKPQESEPRPILLSSQLEVDIDPPTRGARIRGIYRFKSQSGTIAAIPVTLDPRAKIAKLEVKGAVRRSIDDGELGFYRFELERPLGPGQESELHFDIAYEHRGFVLRGADHHFVENGTFFTRDYLPAVAYASDRELTEDETRRRHGLLPKRWLPIDDPTGRARNNAGADVDFIDFEATVSTTPDQIAIAPGILVSEWADAGRRYFHYRVSGPMLNYTGFLSGRYAVRRDAWNDVVIEIDHHPAHTYNIDRMIEGIKRSLDYFTKNFGPYQHKQVRIVEVPRYERFAMSLAAMIPYSESIGFIAKVDEKDREDVDFPFYVTAHEVAHQWWGHQVIGADVQGGEVLSETLCQYSALMVMKQQKGAGAMRKFLEYELNRYLRGRGLAKKREKPLALVESDGYIHYNKGTLVMYALQDAMGEETLNRVLRDLLHTFGGRGAPYPTTVDLVSRLRAASPENAQLIEDLFENITLYDNHVVKATRKDIGAGDHEVHIEALAKKLRADELGDEREVPLDDLIEVGVLDESGNVIAVQKIEVRGERVDVTMTVRGDPAKAGIDPRSMLIDRKPDDNVMPLVRE